MNRRWMYRGSLEALRIVEKWNKAKKREEPQSQLLVITNLSVLDLHPRAERRETARVPAGGREDRVDDMKPMTGIGSCPPLPSKRAARIRRRMSDRKSRMYRLGFALRLPSMEGG